MRLEFGCSGWVLESIAMRSRSKLWTLPRPCPMSRSRISGTPLQPRILCGVRRLPAVVLR
ncbi:hypothetical protein NY08_3665 [Rhodococcus sp. B7740]|nr:hypothetical protein NY08_3665 [Rhodococcus sp. B7740]